ncbi:hypothetical protein GCM10010302_44640 [Streptomyces polychromogenes]|uniref:Transposase IS4-like domain-containing protein n=1 Tax=Streptomyces polychromogenes TaxID=67342 RepID=A0ABN0VH78_9ACTN
MGRPLAFVLTGGNTNDCTQFTAVMDAIRVPRTGPGRPRKRPGHVIGDKGYSSKAIRTWLRRRGIAHTIPERSDQVANGRGAAAEVAARRLSTVRSTSTATWWNGVSTGSSSGAASPPGTAQSYQAAVTLGSLLMWA